MVRKGRGLRRLDSVKMTTLGFKEWNQESVIQHTEWWKITSYCISNKGHIWNKVLLKYNNKHMPGTAHLPKNPWSGPFRPRGEPATVVLLNGYSITLLSKFKSLSVDKFLCVEDSASHRNPNWSKRREPVVVGCSTTNSAPPFHTLLPYYTLFLRQNDLWERGGQEGEKSHQQGLEQIVSSGYCRDTELINS